MQGVSSHKPKTNVFVYLSIFQVDPKLLRNLKFSRKKNKTRQELAAIRLEKGIDQPKTMPKVAAQNKPKAATKVQAPKVQAKA